MKRAQAERVFHGGPKAEGKGQYYQNAFGTGGLFGSSTVNTVEVNRARTRCERCNRGRWQHGRCSNEWCSANNRTRNRDSIFTTLYPPTPTGGSVADIANMEQQSFTSAMTQIESAQETTAQSRARHRHMANSRETARYGDHM